VELKESHARDLRVIGNPQGGVLFLALIAALIAFPYLSPGWLTFLASLVAVYSVAAIGLNLLVGFTGQISLGHAAFLGLGAYATALLARAGAPFPVALAASGLAAALAGVLIGLPTLRLTGPYLAIATLGFGIAVQQVLLNWEEVSGGHMGLVVPRPQIGDWVVRGDVMTFHLVAAVALLMGLVAVNLVRSNVGRAWAAIRDSDLAAEVVGVDLRKYRTMAFAVSAAFTGIAGGLFAYVVRFINPEAFSFFESVYLLAMVVVGGLASVPGSILGAAVITLLPHFLAGLRDTPQILFGTIIIAIMLFEPRGLFGRWLKVKRYWKTWPF